MDTNEEEKKQAIINEKIIEKGYNPEDLSNFITRTKGVVLDEITLEKLNDLIEEFKNEKLKLSSSCLNSIKKSIKDMNDDLLYENFTDIIYCQKQKKSPLASFESIEPIVSE